jgi:hypothetical protein
MLVWQKTNIFETKYFFLVSFKRGPCKAPRQSAERHSWKWKISNSKFETFQNLD